MLLRPIFLSCLSGLIFVFPVSAANTDIQADVLIVGGTESGCAAAVQDARMSMKNIVLVNDIEWLGGLSGAAYEFGPDTKSKYGEALSAAEVFPAADMNPITYCMILEGK